MGKPDNKIQKHKKINKHNTKNKHKINKPMRDQYNKHKNNENTTTRNHNKYTETTKTHK